MTEPQVWMLREVLLEDDASMASGEVMYSGEQLRTLRYLQERGLLTLGAGGMTVVQVDRDRCAEVLGRQRPVGERMVIGTKARRPGARHPWNLDSPIYQGRD